MLLQNVPKGLLPSYRSEFQPPGGDVSAARWACRCRGKPSRAGRPNFGMPTDSDRPKEPIAMSESGALKRTLEDSIFAR